MMRLSLPDESVRMDMNLCKPTRALLKQLFKDWDLKLVQLA